MAGEHLPEAAFALSFDVFQRHAAVAEVLAAAFPDAPAGPIRLLDVGAGNEGFLQHFLPADRFELFFHGPRISPRRAQDPHFSTGSALDLPYADGQFDGACGLDLIAGLSDELRTRALEELFRVTRGPIVLATCCAEDEVRLHEELANAVHRAYFGEGNRWLEARRAVPLPSAEATAREAAHRYGCRAQVLPNGYLPRWSEMTAFTLVLRRVGPVSELAAQVNRYYNRSFYEYDNRAPCYRRLIVLRHPTEVALQVRPEDEEFQSRYAQLQRLLAVGYEMLQLSDLHRADGQLSRATQVLSQVQAGAERLREELGALARENAALHGELAALVRGNAALHDELATLVREKEALHDELATLVREKEALHSELATLAREKEAARAEASARTAELRAELVAAMQEKRTAALEAAALAAELRREAAAARSALAQAEQGRVVSQAEAAVHEARATNLRADLTEVRSTLAQTEREREEHRAEAAALTVELEATRQTAAREQEAHRGESARLRAEAARLQRERADLTAQAAKQRQQLQRLEKRLAGVFASRTYRVGYTLLWPFSLLRRLVGGGKPAGVARVPRSQLHLVQYTPPNPENPFYTLVPAQLAKRGWNVHYLDQPAKIRHLLQTHRGQRVAVSFHQFDPYLRPTAELTGEQRARRFMREVRSLKRAGARLVWTMHNAMPHDATEEERQQELTLRGFVRTHFDRVIVLNHAAREEALRFFPEEMIEVIPHPSMKGAHGPRRAQAEMREKLSFPQGCFIFGTLGAVRPYKGLELLIDAFKGLPGEQLRLLIVGAVKAQDYLDALKVRAAGDERVIIRTGRTVPDKDIPIWLAVPDVAVFGFKTILTSGSAIPALSYGLPVIAPAVGGVPEVVLPGQTGFLYDANEVASLREAMRAAVTDPLLPHLKYMASPSLDEVAPPAIAGQMEHLLSRVLDAKLDEERVGAP